MNSEDNHSFSTGIPALDEILQGVLPGDNIVFQIDRISDFIPFVHEFCKDAVKKNRKLIYFRFADHKPLIPSDIGGTIWQIEINAADGWKLKQPLLVADPAQQMVKIKLKPFGEAIYTLPADSVFETPLYIPPHESRK